MSDFKNGSKKPTSLKRSNNTDQSVIYIDQEKLPIRFTTLVINVNSINQHIGKISRFAKNQKSKIVTNGRLIVMYEITYPPHFLAELVSKVLAPNGLESDIDYTFVSEQPFYGVGARKNPLIGKELPETTKLDWVNSELNVTGCYAWKLRRNSYII